MSDAENGIPVPKDPAEKKPSLSEDSIKAIADAVEDLVEKESPKVSGPVQEAPAMPKDQNSRALPAAGGVAIATVLAALLQVYLDHQTTKERTAVSFSKQDVWVEQSFEAMADNVADLNGRIVKLESDVQREKLEVEYSLRRIADLEQKLRVPVRATMELPPAPPKPEPAAINVKKEFLEQLQKRPSKDDPNVQARIKERLSDTF